MKIQKHFGYSIDAGELQDIKKIRVLCLGLIGDVFIRVPIIEALKKRSPDAEITAIVDPVAKDVLMNDPDCKQVVVFRRKKKPYYTYLFESIYKLILLRREHFDLFVDLYSGGSSPLITRLTSARIRLGFDHKKSLCWSNNLLVKKSKFSRHWTVSLGEKLRPLGVNDNQIRRGSSFYVTESAVKKAEILLPGNSRYLAFNLGAGTEIKMWPVEYFVNLAKKIMSDFELVPIVLTNPDMEHLSKEFDDKFKGQRIRLPSLSLDEVGAVLKRCLAVVTGDTSIIHMVFGVKVPNLVMFTDTRPEIVEPEDCIHVPCFIEDPDNLNERGKPSGTVKIQVGYAF